MLQTFFQHELTEAGCDEAGRGCLAGPVFAAAVVLPKGFFHPLLNDSKQLTEAERNELRPFIQENAVSWAVASLCNKQIDRINILRASFKSMHLALKKLTVEPQLILVDGNRFVKFKRIPHKCIIQGDGIYASIAAASVLAKTYRDDYMKELHLKYPKYNWVQNKGYCTKEHQKALEIHGPCRYHRRSFRLDYSQAELFDEQVA
ncbi:MAG: ribonuclease HII [Chitinophagaceae bacterium]